MAINENGLYIVLLSVHGLIRGNELELGRDADTGGQTKYVVELARALAEDSRVEKVDLFTRRVIDARISGDYAEPFEDITANCRIVRFPFGPKKYLRKEVLWPYLDIMADEALNFIRRGGRMPDIIHSHYADAGYVGARLAGLLGIPLIHTGHSLGRVKRQRLMEQGLKDAVIENQYNMLVRIEAEEYTLDNSVMVIASTHQEVEQQYSLYDHYEPERMRVIPPGVDLQRYSPPKATWEPGPIEKVIFRFLRDPEKPIVLALSRADYRKNIARLVHAYGNNEALREKANLVIIAGNRDDIQTMEKGTREVLTELLLLIDRYNLYGQVAYPKHHGPEDIPRIYRLAAKTKGIFVNPALTEPFGLTLLEAAASGLPVVATEDGGPRDILGFCHNGVLIDPYDEEGIGKAVLDALSDADRWKKWSKSGLEGVNKHYSWPSHTQTYLKDVKQVLVDIPQHFEQGKPSTNRPLVTVNKVLACELDEVLIGDKDSLRQLIDRLRGVRGKVGFCIATGRSLKSALEVMKEWDVPEPDVMITSVGAGIYYGPEMTEDVSWANHIVHHWKPEEVKYTLAKVRGLSLQPKAHQFKRKISYYVDVEKAPSIKDIYTLLRKQNLEVNLVFSHQMYLDVIPIRASKGAALRFFSVKWDVPVKNMLVCGASGSDEEMLMGETLGLVVGNHSPELNHLKEAPRIHFAGGEYAAGILQGIDHYKFF